MGSGIGGCPAVPPAAAVVAPADRIGNAGQPPGPVEAPAYKIGIGDHHQVPADTWYN